MGNELILQALVFIAGLALLVGGGEALVRGAVRLAALTGLSAVVIGLTVVAFGTSAPELAVSLASAVSGSPEIAIGNVVGSNIFNVFLVLGAAGVIQPVTLPAGRSLADGLVALAAMLLLFAAMFTGKRRILDRWEGWVFLLFFALYVGYQVMAATPAEMLTATVST